jgi:tRNA(His) guanylyltransferase
MDKISLGDRMKQYERVSQTKLMRRSPVILRLDGKAFHTYTKDCDKPYDHHLHTIRSEVMGYLCENIQGCLFGYSQSDEISLVLKDWTTLQTDAWFDNKVQKLCSVAASMCTAKWNSMTSNPLTCPDPFFGKLAMFDCRAFNLPKEEVVNYLIWRQQDWERNSVQMLAQSLYSHKELQGLSCKQLITKVEEEHDIIWGNLPSWMKRGEFWMKDNVWEEVPLFKEVRQQLNRRIEYTEEK